VHEQQARRGGAVQRIARRDVCEHPAVSAAEAVRAILARELLCRAVDAKRAAQRA
jgi:hypothetical protein